MNAPQPHVTYTAVTARNNDCRALPGTGDVVRNSDCGTFPGTGDGLGNNGSRTLVDTSDAVSRRNDCDESAELAMETAAASGGAAPFASSTDAVVVDGVYYFACPHCGATIEVVSIACGIFRCGEMKSGKGQIPPHADKATCDRLVKEGKVWGCARPFRFDGRRATVCAYV